MTREQLAEAVGRSIAFNASLVQHRPTEGQRALDRAMAALFDDGEIELAAAVGLLSGFRGMGPDAVAVAIESLLVISQHLHKAGSPGEPTDGN